MLVELDITFIRFIKFLFFLSFLYVVVCFVCFCLSLSVMYSYCNFFNTFQNRTMHLDITRVFYLPTLWKQDSIKVGRRNKCPPLCFLCPVVFPPVLAGWSQCPPPHVLTFPHLTTANFVPTKLIGPHKVSCQPITADTLVGLLGS